MQMPARRSHRTATVRTRFVAWWLPCREWAAVVPCRQAALRNRAAGSTDSIGATPVERDAIALTQRDFLASATVSSSNAVRRGSYAGLFLWSHSDLENASERVL